MNYGGMRVGTVILANQAVRINSGAAVMEVGDGVGDPSWPLMDGVSNLNPGSRIAMLPNLGINYFERVA